MTVALSSVVKQLLLLREKQLLVTLVLHGSWPLWWSSPQRAIRSPVCGTITGTTYPDKWRLQLAVPYVT